MKKLFLPILFAAAVMAFACSQETGAETPDDNTTDNPADNPPAGGNQGTGLYDEPELVDLGLPSGIKWAASDLGSTDPQVPGARFSWGATEASSYFGITNKYLEYENDNSYATKYSVSMRSGRLLDMKTVLDAEDDAATVHLGEGWRTPCYDDFMELLDNCSYQQKFVTGEGGREVQVYEFTSNKNGAKLTFYAQDAIHMSSSLVCNDDRACLNNGIYVLYNGCNLQGGTYRSMGMFVRPVKGGESKPFNWMVHAESDPEVGSGTVSFGGQFLFEEEAGWTYTYSVRMFDGVSGDTWSHKADLSSRLAKAFFTGLEAGKTYYYLVYYEAKKREGSYSLWQGNSSEVRSFTAK